MKPIDILFVCETNAATSLMAEALIHHLADPALRAFSAGSHPAPHRLELAIDLLKSRAIETDGLEPKPLSIFTMAGGRQPDLVVDLATVTWTDRILSGTSAILRWPLRDPALTTDKKQRRAVTEAVFRELQMRINREFLRHVRPLIAS